jgi:predicted ester cyclase
MEDLIIDRGVEDRAVLVFTSEVTHRGDLFGMPGTGRRVENSGAFIIRLENGRIVSERRLYDFTGLLVQLGVLKARAV